MEHTLVGDLIRSGCRLLSGLAFLAALFFGWMAVGLVLEGDLPDWLDLLEFVTLFAVFLAGSAVLMGVGSLKLRLQAFAALPAITARDPAAEAHNYLYGASYWLLFILLPTAAVTYIAWPNYASILVYGLLTFLLFVLIGERGMRQWLRLWRRGGI